MALGCRFFEKNLQSGPRGVIVWCLARIFPFINQAGLGSAALLAD